MPEQKKWLLNDKVYAKRLVDCLSGFFYPTFKWLQYILPENEIHPSLKEQMAIIWLYAMMDALKSNSADIDDLEKYAANSNNQTWLDAAGEIRENIKVLTKLFDKFTKEEQVTIRFLRNYLLHGFLNGYNETPDMCWFDKGKYIPYPNKNWKEFVEMTQPLLGANYNQTTARFLKNILESEIPDVMSFAGSLDYLRDYEQKILKGLEFSEDEPVITTHGL